MFKRIRIGAVIGNGKTLHVEPRKGSTRNLTYLAITGARGGLLGTIVVDKQKLLDAINSTELVPGHGE